MTTTKKSRVRYLLVFEALDDEIAPPYRLKRLLKFAGRSCSFKALRHEELPPAPEVNAAKEGSTP